MADTQPGLLRRAVAFLGNSWVLAAIVLLAATSWMASGMLAPGTASGVETAAEEVEPADEAEAASLPSVRVATFHAQEIADTLRLQGRTEADKHVVVKAETAGAIDEILVERGSMVERGQVIARLDVEDRQARVASAEALVAQRQAEFDAARRLNERGFRGAVELSEAQAYLDASIAALELANIELEHTAVTAPFAGILNDRPVELGDFVDRGDPVASVVDLSVVTAVGQISERNMGKIRLGQGAEVRTLDGRTLQGVVSFVGAVANEDTRTFPVEVDVPNPDNALIEGVTVEMSLPLEELVAHTVTPAILTLDDDGNLGVRGVGEDRKVVFYPVEILRDLQDAVVLGGLPESVRLITVGQEFVREGQEVIPVEDEAAAALVAAEGAG